MLKALCQPKRTAIPLLSFLLILVSVGLSFADGATDKTPEVSLWWIILTIVVLFLVFGGVIFFLFSLQKKYLEVCKNNQQLIIFAQSPAGLPEGSMRAMIAFVIIALSLYLCILVFFQIVGPGSKFPEALSSLLGAVVGFYFGSRSSKGDDGKVLREQISSVEKQRDNAQADTLLSKINKGIVMSKAVIDLLPDEQKKKYGEMMEKLESGYETVSAIAKCGNLTDAVTKGQTLFDLFRKENPARDIFTKALKAIGLVLGGSGPALAVITTVVGCGVQLVGTAYDKWKKRILNVAITPAILPLRAVDANTGMALLLQSPIFKNVFEKKIEANDRPFMIEATQLLTADNIDAFWNTYKGDFDSQEQFEQGLQEFRRAALDRELADETQDASALFAEAGGLNKFMASVDRINADEEAQAMLHQLVIAIETLQKQGEPVPTIFEKVKKEEGL